METELRRCRSNLGILGSGVIVFTVWELVKPLLITLLIPQAETVAAEPAALQISVELAVALLFALLAVFVLDVILRFRIGRAARAEAAGRKKGSAYVVFAFVIFGLQALGFLAALVQLLRSGLMGRSALETAASLLVELSSAVIMGELAFTAVKVRKLSKRDIG